MWCFISILRSSSLSIQAVEVDRRRRLGEAVGHAGVIGHGRRDDRVIHGRLGVHRDVGIIVRQHRIHEGLRHPMVVATGEVARPRVVEYPVARPANRGRIGVGREHATRRRQRRRKLCVRERRIYVDHLHGQPRPQRVGELRPHCGIAAVDRIRTPEGIGGRRQRGAGVVKHLEQARVDVLLCVVRRRERPAGLVALECLRIRDIAPRVGQELEAVDLEDHRGAVQSRGH